MGKRKSARWRIAEQVTTPDGFVVDVIRFNE
jgi:hypothetical protein